MKKVFSRSMLTVCTAAILLSSCKKDSTSSNNAGSANLDAGKSSISLSTSANFAGSNSFSISNTATTQAMSGTSAALRNISLSATEISGTNTRTVMITLITPVDASTTGGSLTGDLSLPNNATILPTITLTSTEGANPGITYGSESGTLTITKLTANEIEGSFSGVVKDVNGTATMNISNGTFAGKF